MSKSLSTFDKSFADFVGSIIRLPSKLIEDHSGGEVTLRPSAFKNPWLNQASKASKPLHFHLSMTNAKARIDVYLILQLENSRNYRLVRWRYVVVIPLSWCFFTFTLLSVCHFRGSGFRRCG